MAAGSAQHRGPAPRKRLRARRNEHSHPGTRQLPPATATDAPANGSPGAQPDADRRLPNRKTNSPATAGRWSSATGRSRPGLRGRTSSTIRSRPAGPSGATGPGIQGIATLRSRLAPAAGPGLHLLSARPYDASRAVRPGDQAGTARGRARPLKEHRRHGSASLLTARHGCPEPDDLQPPAQPCGCRLFIRPG